MQCGRCARPLEGPDLSCPVCGKPPAPPRRPAPAPLPPLAPRDPALRRPAARPELPSSPWPQVLTAVLGLGILGLLGVASLLLFASRPAWLGGTQASPSPRAASRPAPEEAPGLRAPQAPVVASPSALAEAAPLEAEKDLADYYRLISSDRLRDAFERRSRRSRSRTSFGEFEETWSNNRSVRLGSFSVQARQPDRVQARVVLLADDVQGSSGYSTLTPYLGRVDLVREDGRWRYDGGDFTPAPGPDGIVQAFYGWYLAHQEGLAFRGRLDEVRDLFTPALFSHLSEAFARGPREGARVDLDPFAPSQKGARSFEARLRTLAGTHAVVDVTVASGGAGPVAVAVHLEQEGAAWRIADLEYPRDAVRLLGKLQRTNGRS